jgi:hypothetical protein
MPPLRVAPIPGELSVQTTARAPYEISLDGEHLAIASDFYSRD